MNMAKQVLYAFAKYMQKFVQTQSTVSDKLDYKNKAYDLSVVDLITAPLANLLTMFSCINVSGDNLRGKWLQKIADKFISTQFTAAVQTEFNTGDCIVVPSVIGGEVYNTILDADSYNITSHVGSRITGIQYVVDVYKTNSSTYYLCMDIAFENNVNTYNLRVARNGAFGQVPLSVNPHWAQLTSQFAISGVDRLLIAHFKSATVDPNDLNPIKGKPICMGAKKPIAEIKKIYTELAAELELSQKMVFVDKTLFKTKKHQGRDENGNLCDFEQTVLPNGKERMFIGVNGQGFNVDGAPLVHDWAPNIRTAEYDAALDMQYKLLEKCVGVSEGILSKSDTSFYLNLDNIRKSQQQTMAFIDANRKGVKVALLDLMYAWDALADYFNLTPAGEHQITVEFSDEYIETFSDRMNQIIKGVSIGATSPVDYRMWAFDENEEVASKKVLEIAKKSGQQ